MLDVGLWLGLIIAIITLPIAKRAYRHQPGSLQRYKLLSIRRVLSFIVIALALAVAAGAAATGNIVLMVSQTFVGCAWLWADKYHRNDDDFFTRFGRRRRQRRATRRARTAPVSAH